MLSGAGDTEGSRPNGPIWIDGRLLDMSRAVLKPSSGVETSRKGQDAISFILSHNLLAQVKFLVIPLQVL